MADRIDHDWVGKAVRVKAVGEIAAFVGRVEEAFSNGGDLPFFIFFHVRNYMDGTLWHREQGEVSLIEELKVGE